MISCNRCSFMTTPKSKYGSIKPQMYSIFGVLHNTTMSGHDFCECSGRQGKEECMYARALCTNRFRNSKWLIFFSRSATYKQRGNVNEYYSQ